MLIDDPFGFWKKDFEESLEVFSDDVRPQRFTDMNTNLSFIADYESNNDFCRNTGEPS